MTRGHAARRGHRHVPGQGARAAPATRCSAATCTSARSSAAARDGPAARPGAPRNRPTTNPSSTSTAALSWGSRRWRAGTTRRAACCRPRVHPHRRGHRPDRRIDEWMLAEACRQTRAWQRTYPPSPRLGISVNLSGRQLRRPTSPPASSASCGATGLDPTCLTLEITESALMQNLSAAQAPSSGCTRWPSASTWTTSAPGTRRWRTCTASRSTRSRSTGRSSAAWTSAPAAAIVKAMSRWPRTGHGRHRRRHRDQTRSSLLAPRVRRGQGFLFSNAAPRQTRRKPDRRGRTAAHRPRRAEPR